MKIVYMALDDRVNNNKHYRCSAQALANAVHDRVSSYDK